jgi:hypothetical protein
MGRRRPLLVCGDVGNGGEIEWTDLLDADRIEALDSDPSGLVTSYSQTDGLWSLTYTQTGTARDGIREGWLRRWEIPAPYAADERDILLTHIYDITFAGTNSNAILAAGPMIGTGTTVASFDGALAGVADLSSTQVRNTRVGPTGITNINLVDRAGATSVARYAHTTGTASKFYGGILGGLVATGGVTYDAVHDAARAVTPSTVTMALFFGSNGTGTLTGTITFRARYAHIRGPAWS